MADILRSAAEALVNPVNCVGVMGAGLAKQFKAAFPDNFEAYEAACRRGEISPGRIHAFDRGPDCMPRWVINFPTKRHWREASRLDDIEKGLDSLEETIRKLGIRSLAIPPLGCGLGGLDWDDVRPRIIFHLSELVDLEIYMPDGSMAWLPVRIYPEPEF